MSLSARGPGRYRVSGLLMLPEMEQPGTPYLRPDRFGAYYALDYFRRPGWRSQWKWWLCGAALAGSLAWLVLLAARGDEAALASGPVSPIHDNAKVQCAQCHTGWFRPAARLLRSNVHSVRDADCAVCHAGQAASPYHAPHAADMACAECHREHRGNVLLTQVPDAYCTNCHANLAATMTTPTDLADVSSFGGGHPEFRTSALATDPGGLRFNHAVHLRPTGTPTPGGTVKQLRCEDCHPARDGGCYVALPKYANCQECHPLKVGIAGEFAGSDLAAVAAEFARKPVPHVEPRAVRTELELRFAGLIKENPTLLNIPAQAIPLVPQPGMGKPIPQPSAAEEWIRRQVEQAETQLFVGAGGCRLCHTPTSDFVVDRQRARLPSYAPTNLTALWMPRAAFNHAVTGHRLVECGTCHAAQGSTKAADVLMPGIASCQTCHQPGGSGRYDCAECHRYHHVLDRRGACKALKGDTLVTPSGTQP